MRKLTVLLFASIPFCLLQAQEDTTITSASKKKVPYMATVKTLDNQVKKGWFYQMNDSAVVLLNKAGLNMKNMEAKNFAGTQIVQIAQVQTLTLRKRHSIINGMLIGLGAGIIAGTIAGFASGDDPKQVAPNPNEDFLGLGALSAGINNAFAMTAGTKAAIGAVGIGFAGAGIGTLVGALAHKTFTIGGDKKKARELEKSMRERLLVQ